MQAIPEADAVTASIEAHQQANYALAQAHAHLDAARRDYQEASVRRLNAERNVERELLKANAALLESEDATRRRLRRMAAAQRGQADVRAAKRVPAEAGR